MVKPRLGAPEKARLAELVAARTPFWKICEEIDRDRKTTWRNIGYLRRLPPAPPKRSPLRLSLAEREEVSRGLAGGESLRSIARRLGRAPSTVSREVASHGGPRRYRACVADRRALRRMRRPKVAKLAQCPRLRAVVEAKLELRWSPQQISGWLAVAFPDDPEMRVSHETIYLSLYVQARGALRRELARNLRTGRMTRRPAGVLPTVGKGQLRNTVHISERPAEAEDRARLPTPTPRAHVRLGHCRLAPGVGLIPTRPAARGDLTPTRRTGSVGHVSASERGWPMLYVHLRYERPEEAIAWLVRVFAFKEITRVSRSEGRLIVAELEGPAGGTVMVATLDEEFRAWMRERVATTFDDLVPYPWVGAVASLLVDDVDEHWRHSRDAGATVLDAPRDQPWGVRSYAVLDVEGHQWQFAEQRQKVAPEAWGAVRR